MINIILKVVHGSHLYGTVTDNSDKDYKGIYIPTHKDYLLQTVEKCISDNTNITNEKNSKDDVDSQIFSLNNFITLCKKGDTYAIDMLHVNKENVLITSDIWKELRSKRHMFYTSSLYSYTGYLKQQASKYSIKGSRLSDCEELIKFLSQFKMDSRLEDHIDKIPTLENMIINVDHIKIIDKIFQFRTRIGDILKPLSKFLEMSGKRTLEARNNINIDWKSISHAFRSGLQLKEIYLTKDLIYPLKDREYLLDIKLGKYHWVNDNIPEKLDDLLTELKDLSIKSGFPEQVDSCYWDNWLYETIKKANYEN